MWAQIWPGLQRIRTDLQVRILLWDMTVLTFAGLKYAGYRSIY